MKITSSSDFNLDCRTHEMVELKSSGTKLYCSIKGELSLSGANEENPSIESEYSEDSFGNILLGFDETSKSVVEHIDDIQEPFPDDRNNEDYESASNHLECFRSGGQSEGQTGHSGQVLLLLKIRCLKIVIT